MIKFFKVIRYAVVIELGYYLLMMLFFGLLTLIGHPPWRAWPPQHGFGPEDYAIRLLPLVVVVALISLLYGCQKYTYGFAGTALVVFLFVFGHQYAFGFAWSAGEGRLFERDTGYIINELWTIAWVNLIWTVPLSVAIAGVHWLLKKNLLKKKPESEEGAAS
ncbi:MAG: hypothetical protein JSW34_10815 [Candidatus Zixiibacteriota bacterium]|nr:MAG: hypothetical protein JSW34_10815 [candidate division Zixibacteria bacterium]